MDACYRLRNAKNYPDIYIKLTDGSIDYDFEFNQSINIPQDDLLPVGSILNDFNMVTDNELKHFILNNQIFKTDAEFEGCFILLYIPKTKTFHCYKCENEYTMDFRNNYCKRNGDYIDLIKGCYAENIGNSSEPIYSCTSCISGMDILITIENGVKICVNEYETYVMSCDKGKSTSYYIKPLFNCTSCYEDFLLTYNNFYQRVICVENPDNITEENYYNVDNFEGGIESIPVDDKGECQTNYFTPDGEHCFKCNNPIVGMEGCEGGCNFNLNRRNVILCEGLCKNGFIESSKGICEKCDYVNIGCIECHYEENPDYPIDYLGIKTTRKFVCDSCEEGYTLTKEGKCELCSHLLGYECNKCKLDEITDTYKCLECVSNQAFDDEGKCLECMVTHTIINEKCIKCDDKDKGGIPNCNICDKNSEDN